MDALISSDGELRLRFSCAVVMMRAPDLTHYCSSLSHLFPPAPTAALPFHRGDYFGHYCIIGGGDEDGDGEIDIIGDEEEEINARHP